MPRRVKKWLKKVGLSREPSPAPRSSPSPAPGEQSAPPVNANLPDTQIGQSHALQAASPVASPSTLSPQQGLGLTLANSNRLPLNTYSPNIQSHPFPAATPVSSSSTSVSQQQAPATTLASRTALPTNASSPPGSTQINQIHQAPVIGAWEDRAKSAVNVLSLVLKAANAATVVFPPAQAAVGVADNEDLLFTQRV
jgi:hypothetical protein